VVISAIPRVLVVAVRDHYKAKSRSVF